MSTQNRRPIGAGKAAVLPPKRKAADAVPPADDGVEETIDTESADYKAGYDAGYEQGVADTKEGEKPASEPKPETPAQAKARLGRLRGIKGASSDFVLDQFAEGNDVTAAKAALSDLQADELETLRGRGNPAGKASDQPNGRQALNIDAGREQQSANPTDDMDAAKQAAVDRAKARNGKK